MWRLVAAFGVVLLSCTRPAAAQDNGFGDAILALWNAADEDRGMQIVDGGLFGTTIHLQVANNDSDGHKLGNADRVLGFAIGRAGRVPLAFTPGGGGATPEEFAQWAERNANALISYLFPTSISQSVSGRDMSQNASQQFLLSTALGFASARTSERPRRSDAGGLFEIENFAANGHSGLGLQGLYRAEGAHVSVLGRYAQQHERFSGSDGPMTRSLSVVTDFHPSLTMSKALDWRVGGDARAGFLFSHVTAAMLGSLDYGGGVWTSAQRDLSRVRVGAAGMLQGSRSYAPASFAGDLKFLADAINENGIAWDMTYGAIGGVAVTRQVSVNGKYLQTRPFSQRRIEQPQTTLLMGSVSFLVGGITPVDVGYKVSNGAVSAHSVFVQGYFGW